MPNVLTAGGLSRSCLVAAVAAMIFLCPQYGYAAGNVEAAAKFYEDALRKEREGEFDAAIIQLKNALQNDPKLLSAHILMGKIYLRQGKGPAAEEEIVLARRLGADPALTVIPLGQIYLLEGKLDELLTELLPYGFQPELQAKILVLRGDAHVEKRDFNKAIESYIKAQRLAPRSPDPLVGRASALLGQGDLGGAEVLAKKALSMTSDDAGVWNLQASVMQASGQLEEALKAFNRVLELNPDHFDARLARAGLYLDLERDREAAEDLEELREKHPFEPKSAYLYSVYLNRTGEPDRARATLIEAATIIDGLEATYVNQQPALLMVGGLANYSVERFERARQFLSRYVELVPTHAGPRKVLASIMIRDGDYNKAIETLEPAQLANPNDYRVLAMLGEAFMKKGRHTTASGLLEKAEILSHADTDISTKLAFSRLATGQHGLAIEGLEAVVQRDPEEVRPGIVLAMLYLKRGEHAEAVRLTKQLLESDPENLTLANLLATAQLGAGDSNAARISYEKALTLDRDFMPARINLGKLDRQEGNTAGAEARFLRILTDHPDHIPSMIELARIEELRERPEEAVRWLEKARRANPEAMGPRIRLVDMYLKAGDPQTALSIAKEAEEKKPEDLDVLAALAKTNLAVGKKPVARVVLKRMATLAGFDAPRLHAVAMLQQASGAGKDAVYTLEKAITGDPNYIPARIDLGRSYLNVGRLDKAWETAAFLKEKAPDRPEGHRLVGDIFAKQGQFDDAYESYRTSFAISESPELLVQMSTAQDRAGDAQGAQESLIQWVSKHPEDVLVKHALAESHLRMGQMDAAKKVYAEILKSRPQDALALNNLAVIYARTRDSRAVETATKAHSLAPENASTNDTLGWILVQAGQHEKGLTHLREAHSRSSFDPEIRYHIAVALDRLGGPEEAREELQRAFAAKQPFEGMGEARDLLNRLSK